MCVMSAYLSLSPLLHFVLKFSIQKIKGGERDECEQRERDGEEESAIMDFISIVPILPQKNIKKSPKITHFKNKPATSPFPHFCQHAFHSHTLAMLLSE